MSVVVTKKMNKTRRSILLQGILFLMLLLVAVYFFMNSSFFSIREIQISGLQKLKRETVLELAGVNVGANLIKLDIEQVKNNIELSSLVESVRVERRFPDRLLIHVTERRPAALAAYRDGFILLDEAGYYLQLVQRITEYSLPLIVGVQIPETAVPGEKISVPGLAEGLKVVSRLSPQQLALFSEINVQPGDRLELYTIDGIKVIVGDSSDLARKIQWFLEIYRQWQAGDKARQIQYVDVSFDGHPIVKYKN